MHKLILRTGAPPGDVLALTGAVRDLHRSHPGLYATDVRTQVSGFWQNNPFLTPLMEHEQDVTVIDCRPSLGRKSATTSLHFLDEYRLYLQETLSTPLFSHRLGGDIHLSLAEKTTPAVIDRIIGKTNAAYWLIVCGGKRDATVKWWNLDQAQQVVDYFEGRLHFVQCGAAGSFHHHPRLRGVVDLVGKTSAREMVHIMYYAQGVVCPVTMFLHLAAAVETPPTRHVRPIVVLAGGREPPHYFSYPQATVLHTIGCLPCCAQTGCWRSRTVRLEDGSPHDASICQLPVEIAPGRFAPRCMTLITADDVIRAIERYLQMNENHDKVTGD